MNIKSILVLLILINFNVKAQKSSVANNQKLAEMYKNDQAERTSGSINWKILSKNDSIRRAEVNKMILSEKVNTAQDYYNAAMIFQHGNDTIASDKAVKYMKKAVNLDPEINKWLLAAAIDRDLMRKGKPQIYGTQYVKNTADAPYELYKIDTTQITDKQRIAYSVPTLQQARERLKMMNKKKIQDLYLSGTSVDEIINFIKSEDLQNSEYDLSEMTINTFGYMLMGQNKNKEALKVLELNTRLYPNAANTWDSYGEILMKLERNNKSITAYEKSVKLNPENQNAKDKLKELQ